MSKCVRHFHFDRMNDSKTSNFGNHVDGTFMKGMFSSNSSLNHPLNGSIISTAEKVHWKLISILFQKLTLLLIAPRRALHELGTTSIIREFTTVHVKYAVIVTRFFIH
jgi:hypothetical protein